MIKVVPEVFELSNSQKLVNLGADMATITNGMAEAAHKHVPFVNQSAGQISKGYPA